MKNERIERRTRFGHNPTKEWYQTIELNDYSVRGLTHKASGRFTATATDLTAGKIGLDVH